jgi:tetrapyrrole methylase family protein / MazG family protein
MIRLLRLSGEPLPESLLDELRATSGVFHVDAAHPSFGALAAAGVAVRKAPDELPKEAQWLVVPVAAANDRVGDSLARLVVVVDRLLGPGGCPWDQAQTHETLKRHLLEEAYEVLDAIDSGSMDKLCEELGDLLLQPIMHAQMEALQGRFDIADVAQAIHDKLVRRHPHVFGPLDAKDADEVLQNWDRIKQTERSGEPESLLEGVPKGMASLLRAFEVSKRAARAGFEWPNLDEVFAKLAEEERELREALEAGDSERIEAEIGDLLFTAVNLARWAKIEPEEALRKMLNRFTARFQEMERAADKPLGQLTPQEWDDLWNRAKAQI